jgi:capsular polysaccharide biosynthesis protein
LDMLTETFKLPSQKFDFYELELEEPRLEKALVPSLMHNSHIFHPAMRQAVHDIVQALRTRSGGGMGTGYPQYIYISRDKFRDRTISSKRELSNEDEIKAIVRARGIEVVYPEELPWNEQVNLFSNARLIVGESGSGLHNSIFAPEGAIVLCMQPSTQVQGTLSALLGHPTAFLCPESAAMIDGTCVFDIDLKRFSALLDQCLARTRL